MILTVEVLNQSENKFTPHGLGIEAIEASALTYNSALTALNNGYLPIIKILDAGVTIFEPIKTIYYTNNTYEIETTTYSFYASTTTEIMTLANIA